MSTRDDVGTTNPQTNLDVSGSIFHSGIITDLSDRRFKQDVHVLPSALQQILRLIPMSYQKKMTPDLKEFGFMAQDVMTIFPNLVTTANDPSKTMSLNYIGLIAPTIRAVQEIEANRQLDFATLKAANDNLVSETMTLRLELKAANDNYRSLKEEVDGLKKVEGKR
jgi:hypothetical protein